eukprot:122975_1
MNPCQYSMALNDQLNRTEWALVCGVTGVCLEVGLGFGRQLVEAVVLRIFVWMTEHNHCPTERNLQLLFFYKCLRCPCSIYLWMFLFNIQTNFILSSARVISEIIHLNVIQKI